MNREVLSVKEHTCPTCGGQLRVNTAKQMYECPFCGVTFDYEYFREEDVLQKAGRALAMGEYHSAGEAYDFMLDKEPNNFVALRGLILAGMCIRNTSSMGDISIYESMQFDKIDTLVDRAVTNAKSEHHDYFSSMKELVDMGHEYKDELISLTKVRTDKKEQARKVERAEDKKYSTYITTLDPVERGETTLVSPKGVISIVLVIYIAWCLISGMIYAATRDNPYSRENYSSRQSTKITYASNRNYLSWEPVKDSDGKIVSYKYTRNEGTDWRREAERKEEKERMSKYRKWNREHENDYLYLIAALLIPLLPVGLIIAALTKRYMKERVFDKEINKEKEKLDKIGSEIGLREEKIELIKKKFYEYYKELRKKDPMPDIQSA
ncbi:MAG: hypothetical protein J6U54_19410 [Clostridiales bacterium]|nr:hypothetical protein [Clostridiales bacterium]